MKQMRTGILAAAVTFAVAAPAAFAADGTITINGQVTAQTCTISGNGGGKDFTVTLPTVSAAILEKSGMTAGRTPFNIALSKCTPNSGSVAVYFEPGATVDTTTGRLVNTATAGSGGAGNVQIGLLNSDNSEIRLGSAFASQNSKSVALTSGAATLGYFAQYVATGQATPGNVTTSTLYSIVYQ